MGWLPAVTLALTLGACAQLESTLGPAAEEQMTGAWRWVESTGGLAGSRFTPADQGYSVGLVFAKDGVVEIRRDGELVQRVGFDVRRLPPESSETGIGVVRYGRPFDAFPFDPAVEEHIVQLDRGERLILNDGCCDRYMHVFERSE